MSRRIMWFAIASAVCVAFAVMVYSMQTTDDKKVYGAMSSPGEAQQQSNSRQAGKGKESAKAKDPDAAKILCTLTAGQSPDIRGVRLGMELKQVLAAFPGSSEDSEMQPDLSKPPSQFGETRFIIKPDKYGSKENFVGIKSIIFGFLDGRVSDVNVAYDGPAWKNVDEFVANFSEGKTLPAIEAWEAQAGMDTLKNLKCDGFEISIFAGGRGGKLNYVQMRDSSAMKELEERQAKFIKKSEKEAKP
jgi:hypothetical protein